MNLHTYYYHNSQRNLRVQLIVHGHIRLIQTAEGTEVRTYWCIVSVWIELDNIRIRCGRKRQALKLAVKLDIRFLKILFDIARFHGIECKSSRAHWSRSINWRYHSRTIEFLRNRVVCAFTTVQCKCAHLGSTIHPLALPTQCDTYRRTYQ